MTKELYHVGLLAFDRQDPKDKEAALNVAAKADEAWRLYEAGLVTLVQKKISINIYEYWMHPTAKGAAA